MIGIYRIKNISNDKCYYGSSKNIEVRWRNHINKLNKGSHENVLLQRAWDKYGEGSFIFEVIQECGLNVLLVTEQKYLNSNPAYNIGLCASGGDNITNHPNKALVIANIKRGSAKYLNSLTPEERKEKFGNTGHTNNNWQGGKTFCKCGNKINSGTIECIDCVDRSGSNNSFFGKKHTRETKDIIAKSRKGKYHGTQNNPIIVDDIEYRSAGEASKLLNIPMVTIRWRVRSDSNKFKDYKYK